MKRRPWHDLAHICTLVLVPGVLAWAFGLPLIFPSLGPSAFALVVDPRADRARRVIGGHAIGVLSGLLAYHVLAPGLTLAALSTALSVDGLRIVASAVVSIALAAGVMTALRANHAPACATTLIVSLGVLPGFADAVVILVAVSLMFVLHRLVLHLRKRY